MDNKKNDFLATLVKNPDLTLTDLKTAGITPDNTALLSKEEYKGIAGVQEAFKGDDGKFDEKKFNTFYDNARILYNNYANDSFLESLPSKLTYSEDEWYAPKDAIYRQSSPIIVKNQRPIDYDQGIKYLTEITTGTNDLSIREQAQNEKVFDFETGQFLDYTPNDKAGVISRFSMPTLVLAQYDTDGTHIEGGVEVSHKAGDLKLNDNGKPYYETLGNREIYNKDVLRMSDVLTVDGSPWNAVDIFDKDDIKVGAGKVALNMVARVAPYLVPGVGEVWGALSAAHAINRLAPVLGKAINGFILGDNNNAFGQAMSKWEGRMATFDQTASDYSREHMVTFENLGNLIGDVAGQLFQQQAVAHIPYYIQKMTGGDVKKVTDLSKNLALAYMAATSAQDTYSAFKEAGASDRAAGLGMLASTAALYKLMNIDYFRDNLFKNTFMDDSEIRSITRSVARTEANELATSAKLATPKEAATFLQKAQKFYEEKLVDGIAKKGAAGVLARGLSEGAEETMEEVTTDLIKGVFKGAEALGVDISGEGKKTDFGFSLKDIASRYAMSFGGGFIGGMVFAGQNKYAKWRDKVFMGMEEINPSDMEKLVYLIATGNRSEIDYYLDKWHEKGVLGDTNLAIDGDVMTSLDGKEQYVPKTFGTNQNDAVYNVLKNTLDTIQQAVESETYQNLFSSESWNNLMKMGYSPIEAMKENPNLLGASTLVALQDYSSFQKDFHKNLAEIVNYKLAIKERKEELLKAAPTANTEDEKKTQAESINNDAKIQEYNKKLDELRKEREKFLNGEKNRYYSGQALFAANENLHKEFVDLSRETYAKLKKGRSYESLNEDDKKKLDAEYDEYYAKEGREKIYRAYDFYLSLAEKFAPIIQKHGEILDKDYKKDKELPQIFAVTDYLNTNIELKKLKKEAEELQNKITTLKSQESTPEVDQQIRDAELELSDNRIKADALDKQQRFALLNANLSTISVTDRERLEALIGSTNSEGNISLSGDTVQVDKDNNVILTPGPVTKKIFDGLRKEYAQNADKGEYRYDDNEYFTALKLVAKTYAKSGGAERAVSNYLSDLNEKYIKQDDYYGSDYLNSEIEQIFEKEPGTKSWFSDDTTLSENQTEIAEQADRVVQNLGVDNAAAIRAYEELLNLIGEKTNLLEPENKAYLDEFLKYLIPHINGESIIDIIKEVDNLRENKIHYSAYYDIAKEIGTDVQNLNLLDIIQKESMNLASSPRLDEYIIKNKSISQALDSKSLAPIFKIVNSLIGGAASGINTTINSFSGAAKDAIELPVMSQNAANLLLDQKTELANRINFLKILSDANNAKSLRKHKDTSISMTPKWAKAILGLSDSFNKSFDIDLSELWKEVSGGIELDKIDENNFTKFEPIRIKFEQRIFEEFNKKYVPKTDPIQRADQLQEIADKLIDLVDAKTLYKAGTTLITPDKDIEISSRDLIYHLATTISIPSEAFYSALKGINDPNWAPVYGQVYAIKQVIGQIINPELFNYILSKIKSKSAEDLADSKNSTGYKEFDESIKTYWEKKSILPNLGVILGGAGSGKTVGVIKKILALMGEGNDYKFIARQDPQAKKLRNSAGYDKGDLTVDEYCTTIFGQPVTEYIWNKDTGHFSTTLGSKIVGSNFNEGNFKIAVIDEIEMLSEPELQLISQNAKEEGIFVIGLGDLKQPSSDFGKKEKFSSGIEDCLYVSTPTLTTTMRAQRIAKVENAELMGRKLDNIIHKAQTNPSVNLDERDKEIEKFKLFYATGENGEVYGDMIVSNKKALLDKLEAFKKLDGTIAIITDRVGEYTNLAVPGKVEIVDYKNRAGGEWDYVLVDADLDKYSRSHKYLLARDLYTLTQRSTTATIIKETPKLKEIATFEKDQTKSQETKIENSEIESFTNWWLSTLNEVTTKTPLSEYLKQSPLFKSNRVTNLSESASESKPNPKPESEEAWNTNTDTNPAGNPNETPEKPKANEETKLDEEDNSPRERDDEKPEELAAEEEKPIKEEKDSREKKKENTPEEDTIRSSKFKLVGTIEAVSKAISDDFFTPKRTSNPLEFHSVRLVFPDFDADKVKQLYTRVGSLVRTGNWNNNFSGTVDGIIEAMIFRDYQGPDALSSELWLLPYEEGVSLLVSRHYNKVDRSKYFDVPILFTENPAGLNGKYTGTIKLEKGIEFKNDHEKRVPIMSLATNAGLFVNNVIGIPVYNTQMGDLDKPSYKWIEKYTGRSMALVTDEWAVANKIFPNAFRTSNGYSLTGANTYQVMGVQCTIPFRSLLATLDIYRETSEMTKFAKQSMVYHIPESINDKEEEYDIYNNSSSLSSEEFEAKNIELLRNANNNIRQILPYGRSGQLLATVASNVSSVAHHIRSLIEPMYEGDQLKIDNSRRSVGVLTFNVSREAQKSKDKEKARAKDKDYYKVVGITKDGFYRTGKYKEEVGFVPDEDSPINIDVNNPNPIAEIINTLYKDISSDQFVEMHMKQYIYNVKNKKGFTINMGLRSNYELARIFEDLSDSDITTIERVLEKEGFTNGIYVDDRIPKDGYISGGHWGRLDRGHRVYTTDMTNIKNYSTYSIDLSEGNIEMLTITNPENPSTEDTNVPPIITKPTLSQFIADHSKELYNITASTIEEANKKLASRVDQETPWKVKSIEETIDGFKINETSSENLKSWLETTTKTPIADVDFNELEQTFINTKPGQGGIRGTLIWYKEGEKLYVYSLLSKNPNINYEKLISAIDSIFKTEDTTLIKYTMSQIMPNIVNNSEEVINLLKNNPLIDIKKKLDICEKIANFEQEYINIFGCK